MYIEYTNSKKRITLYHGQKGHQVRTKGLKRPQITYNSMPIHFAFIQAYRRCAQ